MTLVEIYADLRRRGCLFFSGDYDLDAGADAVTIKMQDGFGVFLDDRRITTTAKEKVAASHEWAHIVEDATYGIEAPPELVRMAEYIATRRQYEAVLPWGVISRYLRRGCSSWDIAETEGLTQAFVEKAIEYWTTKRGKKA